ncbi:MAG: phenylalanine--tRNA ligase subunit alpha, partial [Clostridia bacterium]|nr:phenylalanine--tRNA ligase subunit alpha [Clostridia bacterium]
MKEKLQQIKEAALLELKAADCDTEALRVRYLGKKGELTAVLRGMGALSPEERPIVGALANEVRAEIESAIAEKQKEQKQKELEDRLAREKLDVTMPGKCDRVGHQHPLTRAQREMEEIFIGMGFEIAEGPEVEYDYYNFQALNIPENHPARDTQDTFYITDKVLLRSQTSPVQVRVMEQKKPPIRVISPGRVYRSDALDA